MLRRLDPVSFSIITAIAVGSSAVFFALCRRELNRRRDLRLTEWASGAGMKPIDPALFSVPPLFPIADRYVVRTVVGFMDVRTAVLSMRTALRGESESASWNVAYRTMLSTSNFAGLRPVRVERSIVDLFAETPAAHQTAAQRFVVVGSDLAATRRLAESSIPSLLPADLGLVRVGQHLLIDFSTRPFDEIEMNRIKSVLDQVASLDAGI
jgi:hypothetical protein